MNDLMTRNIYDVRGRVLSVWSMIAAGVMPVGSLLLGGLASLTGQVTHVLIGGASAALLGARGNSGVILSQIVRGAAEELASRPGELVDPERDDENWNCMLACHLENGEMVFEKRPYPPLEA